MLGGFEGRDFDQDTMELLTEVKDDYYFLQYPRMFYYHLLSVDILTTKNILHCKA
jgi:hypothetical protein